jgi:hypothetical protein
MFWRKKKPKVEEFGISIPFAERCELTDLVTRDLLAARDAYIDRVARQNMLRLDHLQLGNAHGTPVADCPACFPLPPAIAETSDCCDKCGRPFDDEDY